MLLFIHTQVKRIGGYYLTSTFRLFNKVLADFAQHFGIGRKKQVVLVVDQAGWHTSEQVKIPEGMHLEFLPSHSPELQPLLAFVDTHK